MRRWTFFVGLAALWLLAVGPAGACPVCYGESDSPMARGAEMSILFMAVLTYVMILGGIAFFVFLRLRARRHAIHLDPAGESA